MPNSALPYTVSIVEDERILREELTFQLQQLGFDVQAFADVEAFFRYLAVNQKTLLVLDIGLNGEDGLSACRYLREHGVALGIVFVTARSLQDERMLGLEAGADAYLVKPVNAHELAVILHNLGQRLFGATLPPDDAVKIVPSWRVDSGKGVLLGPNAIAMPLSRDEERLLNVLLEHPNDVCPTIELALAIGMMLDTQNKHRIEVILSRLRQRTLRLTGRELPLRTIRGMGYQFCNNDEV